MSQFKDIFTALKKSDKADADSRATQPSEVSSPKLGRPREGKRSNPDYKQVTAYVKKQTYRQVKRILVEQEQEFSDLVQELLEDWLSTQKVK